jgi:eukaryotic-like serine/threonine-protein kinase
MSVLASHHMELTPQPAGSLPERIFGFVPLRVIGRGAGSVIYAVRDPATGKTLALKHVQRLNDKAIRFVEQLQNEVDVAKRVNHPKLRRIYEVKLEKTLIFKVTGAALLMDLFEGQSLDDRLPPDNVTLVKSFIDVADALGAMHKAGFVHCDLKPANILLSHDFKEVRVIDLGQACPIGTKKERIQGTPDYISPEQVKLLPVDERTDVYNLGATMYWCLCGEKLPTLFTLKRDENSFLVDAFIKAPHEINRLVPENLSHFVMEMCRVNATKRPQSMSAVIDRLEIILHGLRKG